MLALMDVTSRIGEIERQLADRGESVARLCRMADLAQTTWGRWKNGAQAKGASWRKIELALPQLLALSELAPEDEAA
jgi:hypothetical protein